MDTLVDLLKHCEITTILALFLGFYIFNGMMNKKFDKMETKFEAKFDKIDSDIKEIRTSLNRMEGAFYSKECCMLKDDQKEKVK